MLLGLSSIVCGLPLLGAGFAILIYSDVLMNITIYHIGYEKVLGKDNVIRQADGAVFLTNPGKMALWTLPYLCFGFVLLISSILLFLSGYFTIRRVLSEQTG